MTYSLGNRGSKHHGDQAVITHRTYQKRSFREELAAPGKQHDVAKKFQATRLAAILVIDLAINMIGIGKMDKARGRFKGAVGPGLESETRRNRFATDIRLSQRQYHELPGIESKILRKKNGIQLRAKRHELRFNALQARSGAQRSEYFRQEVFRNSVFGKLRRNKQAPNKALVVFENVKAIAQRPALFQSGIAPKSAGVDELPNQFN